MNKKRVERILKDAIPYIIVVVIVILIRSFIVTPAVVDGDSMLPTLKDNNIIILNKLDYKLNDINRFDIVVVKDLDKDLIIKRVIGLPGETIEFKNNKLYIENKEFIDMWLKKYNKRHNTKFTCLKTL